ncbi:MAG: cytochrome d ubiquinol oxidase subunit II [Pseudomonadota bacterium]
MWDEAFWLPFVFAALMALAIYVYALLDGFDLGVGLLVPLCGEDNTDTLLASIGPFWDANETWLVLAVGLLLIAFPAAHSLVLGEMYLAVGVLLIGLILRGVAFDLRAKVHSDHVRRWNALFFLGSLLATLSQGYMLGQYIMGFERSFGALAFSLLSAVCVTSAYAFIGAAWLVLKCEGELQRHAADLCRRALRLMMLGVAVVSIVNPLVSSMVFERWFNWPASLILAPIPMLSLATAWWVHRDLGLRLAGADPAHWIPFAGAAALFTLSFIGLAYSFYPYIVPQQITIWQGTTALESLRFVLVGVVIALPAIIIYTVMSYRVFWGKARELKYY